MADFDLKTLPIITFTLIKSGKTKESLEGFTLLRPLGQLQKCSKLNRNTMEYYAHKQVDKIFDVVLPSIVSLAGMRMRPSQRESH